MRKIILLSTILIGGLLLHKPATAQVHINVNINTQPAWVPVEHNYAEYYYLPEVEAYYCVPRHRFVYFDRGNWVSAPSLPERCGNYDLYSGYKVVMNEPAPWNHFYNDRVQYASYVHRHDQMVINNGRSYGRGGYDSRSDFSYRDRDQGNRWSYHDNRRQNRERDDDRNDGDDNDSRYYNKHGNHGRGRW